MLFTIARLYKNYKPMRFFGLIAAILMIISVAFFIPVLAQYIDTGEVARFPTLIACGFTAIAAVQAFFSGMILGCIVQKNRQDFEINLQRTDERYKDLLRKNNKEEKDA
ncbi:MAG: hypothetical protein II762_02245 [Ruminococcus sp.]|nr:hypothetical protein [Ruminococcus sp.]